MSAPASSEEREQPELTIVLVDDDPLMHRMLVPRLEEMATRPRIARVRGVRTPEEAMDETLRAPAGPLAVVSDFNLRASKNGLQLLREIRGVRPDALRVLFSGYSLEQLGDVHGGGDADAFLEKPLLLDDLIGPLQGLIERRFASS
ncbi:MAG TPA: hypothetical protein VFH78_08385 [Candidatus Thermoplasmatota archaeon]|nr:hypothetical protein [Candidatus Thermoplasmatota archaeon]